ncbi:predicted protein [Nematostella vectensis]|uniref:Mab-21-like nucleotidyltransferase domain-containing protein n=1 Tax=Nematostella vectensis TaxID=45351 RepID=A7S297_NEMVE|nr:predicted protein [Nematostella vectensis]|eukprot:XP_001634310.1 predicted protein [Nematostella vectensis]
MLRAFSKDMEVNISKEKKNTKDMFKIHVIEQVLKRCQEKYPKRISRFDVAGNLYDNLKTEGPDEEDATVLLILAKKKIVHEITQSGCALFLVKDASSEYAVDCSDEEGFLLPEKIIKWLFNLLQKESKSYQQSQDVIKINVSQLKQYSGVRLRVRDISIGYTLLVNVVPTLVAEEKVFSTSHLLLSTCLCPDDQPLERRWSPCFVLEEKKQLANMDTDGGCRHELFRVSARFPLESRKPRRPIP